MNWIYPVLGIILMLIGAALIDYYDSNKNKREIE